MQPFIKWAGGKRWLVDELRCCMPETFDRYFEPFLGGGAVFFGLAPKRAVLSDINGELIAVYRAVRDHPAEIEDRLLRHQERHSDAYYYEVRASSPAQELDRAARFLYLNRSCWNGLYRVNLKGRFNVPRGTKNQIVVPGENLCAISNRLTGAEIEECDFEKTLAKARTADLVYIDPPYTVKHNVNGFIKYNQRIFSWSDQIRLRDACFAASERGATVLVSNADHESIRELYENASEARTVSRYSVLAGNSTYRQPTTELILVIPGEM